MRNWATIVAGLVVFSAAVAQGAVLDLTTAGSSGTINGAIFTQGMGVSGTGVFPAIVRINGDTKVGIEQGYTTSASPPPFDEIDAHTEDVLLGNVGIVSVGGTSYFSFLLDINESGGGGNEFLSVDKIQLYTSNTGGKNTTDVTTLGTLRYDLDAGADSEILLDFTKGAGGGKRDMEMLVPVWPGANGGDYLYLYSQFGEKGEVGGRDYGHSDGFEEWAANTGLDVTYIPEPASLVVWSLLGALGMFVAWRGRRGKAG